MRYVLLFTCLAMLTSCGYVRETLDLDRTGPDEYDVSVAAPLTIPPDFSLRPPTPGAERPQEIRAEEKARQALLGSATDTTPVVTDTTTNDLAIIFPDSAPVTDASPPEVGAENTLLDNTKSYASQPTMDGSIPQPEAMRAVGGISVTAPGVSSDLTPEQKVREAPPTPAEDTAAPKIEAESKDDDTSFWGTWF